MEGLGVCTRQLLDRRQFDGSAADGATEPPDWFDCEHERRLRRFVRGLDLDRQGIDYVLVVELRQLQVGHLLAQEVGKDTFHEDLLVLSGSLAARLVAANMNSELNGRYAHSDWQTALR